MAVKLFDHQKEALGRMKNGCILNGGVGSGKSITGLAYYFTQQGGGLDPYSPMHEPRDLYIITTAQKRNNLEWEGELRHFLLSTKQEINGYDNKVVVDSWNNIKKYKDVYGAFFIFDEQRVCGSGAWVKTFYNLARKNKWILLSATPGDNWHDYFPVFKANGFFKTKKEFEDEHVVWNRYTNYPSINRYINEGRLLRYKKDILIDMDFERFTIQHHEDCYVQYDITKYRLLMKDRWNIYEDCPIINAAELCYLLRKVVNSDTSRQIKLLEILEDHPRAIIFYNYDYELDILKNLYYGDGVEVAEYNGHRHDPLPEGDRWIYLVNYSAGNAGWNCITTDTVIFFSQNYSYKVMKQASGRIDRLNTPYKNLYYYHLKSRSGIDLAISKALSNKKKFNEAKWAKW